MQHEARRLAKFRSRENAYEKKYFARGFPHAGNNTSSDLDSIVFGSSSSWPSRWETTSSFFSSSPFKAPKFQTSDEPVGLRPEHELVCPQLLGCVKTIPRVRRTRQVPWGPAAWSTPLVVARRHVNEAQSNSQTTRPPETAERRESSNQAPPQITDRSPTPASKCLHQQATNDENLRSSQTAEHKESSDQVPPGPARPHSSAQSFPSTPLRRAAASQKTPSASKASELRQCMNTPFAISTPIRDMRSLKVDPRNSIEFWTLSSPRTGTSPVPSRPPSSMVQRLADARAVSS